jgi:hypothetical protein
MHLLRSKYIRVTLIILVSLIVIVSIGGWVAWSKREILLQKAIGKAKAKAKKEYNLDVKIGSARFTGLGTVAFSDITVVPEQRDSLLSIKKFEVSVKLMPLVMGEVQLSDVTLEDGHLNLTSRNHVRNFDFLFKKKKDTTEQKSKVDLSQLANNLVNQVLYKIPENLDLKNFLITFVDDSNRVTLNTPVATIKDGNLSSTINVNNGEATWHVAGRMRASDKDIDVKLYADHQKVELPIIEKKFHLKLNFDTIQTRLTKVEHSGGETRIYGSWGIRNLLVNHQALASNDIIVPNGSIDANVFIGENYVSVDSSSTIHLKSITAHPFIKYTLRPHKIYELKLHTGWMNAQDLWNSFPEGMFESLEGMQVSGKLNYGLNFYLDSKDVDHVQFDSRMDKQNFHVIKYGKTDFSKLNSPFVYTPYEKGKPMPPRFIGPSNPNFTPLEDISPDLRNAVMTAEDPTFFRHHGFVEESIRKSIATDVKEKKFKRGGSTISMQLVKNAFLNRQKTLARKIEETLIVWMIENAHVMTKNRMLEVYFNIIEWGRNVYGVGEGAKYYFDKKPSELTLGESIYMASIVPNPKAGLYAFLGDGSLNPRLHGYFRLIGNLMARSGLTVRDTSGDYGIYNVRLKPSLRRETSGENSNAAVDSLMHHEDDDSDANPFAPPIPAAPTPRDNNQSHGTSQKPVEQTPEPEHKGFFSRIFGHKDTVHREVVDTSGLAPKPTKKELREQRRRERERQQQLQNRSVL